MATSSSRTSQILKEISATAANIHNESQKSKESKKKTEPASISDSKNPEISKSLKRSYTEFMTHSNFAKMSFENYQERWPKYLGSLLVKEDFSWTKEDKLKQLKINSKVEFNYGFPRGHIYKATKKDNRQGYTWKFSLLGGTSIEIKVDDEV